MKCYNCDRENLEGSKFCSNCGCTLVMEADYSILNRRYKILEIISAGGMSTVLKAEDQNLGNSICVIKEMSNYFNSQKERIYAIQKFKEEAFILAKMRYSNIPVVTDYFVENDKYYLVMNYIYGKNLKQVLLAHKDKRLSEDEVKNIGIQICGILEYLHNLNPPIIHRDLKPTNFIMEEGTGKVILIDFGIARKFEPEKTGTLIGTPGYMAPEQYIGKIDLKSDIFGLGATLHHLITGEDPADRESLEFSLVTKLRPEISLHMENIISRALEQDTARRFRSATEMKQALMQKEYIEMPVRKTPFKPSEKSRTLPRYMELSQKTNIKPPDITPDEAPKRARRIGTATVVPASEAIINVQLHSFLGKETIRDILGKYAGIDIGSMYIKIVQMNIDERYFMYPAKIVVIPTPEGTMNNGLIVNPKKLGNLLKKTFTDYDIKGTKVITSVPKNRGHFYTCLLKEMPETKLQELLPQLAKEHFPFYKQGIILDYQVIHSYLPGQEGKMEIIVGGAEKDVVDGIKQTVEESGLGLSSISFQPFLINQAINLLVSENIKSKCVAVIDIGAESTSINIVKDGSLWYTSTLAVGGNDFTRAIAAELKLNFDEAENLKKKNLRLNLQKGATESEFVLFSLVTGLIKKMLNDIITVMENFKIKYKIVSSIPVIFSGGTSIIKNFDKYVENELRVRCLKFKMPVSKVDDVNKELALELGPSLMVGFSLSMNKIIRSGDQQELSDEKPQEKKSLWDILTAKLF